MAAGADEGSRRKAGDTEFEEEFEEEEKALKAFGGARSWGAADGPFKLMLIVNMELKMGKGKASGRDRTCCLASMRKLPCSLV